MSDQMQHFLRSQIRGVLGDDGLAKAEVVAERAALLRGWDPDIDMAALVVGLWVGHSGDMPETMPPLTVLGSILTLAIEQGGDGDDGGDE